MKTIGLAVLRHFARPYVNRPMTKRKAGIFTVIGMVCIVVGSVLLIGSWGDMSHLNRAVFIAGLGMSIWVMPWSWANLLR